MNKLETLATIAEHERDALNALTQKYGFHGKMDDECLRICKKRLRSVMKQCVEIALLDADKKHQQTIVQSEQMPLVRKRMRICAWKEETE
jgi:hypothetical protein